MDAPTLVARSTTHASSIAASSTRSVRSSRRIVPGRVGDVNTRGGGTRSVPVRRSSRETARAPALPASCPGRGARYRVTRIGRCVRLHRDTFAASWCSATTSGEALADHLLRPPLRRASKRAGLREFGRASPPEREARDGVAARRAATAQHKSSTRRAQRLTRPAGTPLTTWISNPKQCARKDSTTSEQREAMRPTALRFEARVGRCGEVNDDVVLARMSLGSWGKLARSRAGWFRGVPGRHAGSQRRSSTRGGAHGDRLLEIRVLSEPPHGPARCAPRRRQRAKERDLSGAHEVRGARSLPQRRHARCNTAVALPPSTALGHGASRP